VLGVVVQRVDPGEALRHVVVVAVCRRRRVHLDDHLVTGPEHVAEREDLDEVLVDLTRRDVRRVRVRAMGPIDRAVGQLVRQTLLDRTVTRFQHPSLDVVATAVRSFVDHLDEDLGVRRRRRHEQGRRGWTDDRGRLFERVGREDELVGAVGVLSRHGRAGRVAALIAPRLPRAA
jgi:hypothetical protein